LGKEEKEWVKVQEVNAENIREASDKFKAITPIRDNVIRPIQK